MTTLREALTRSSWRLLLFIGRRRSLRLSSNAPKAYLIDRLEQALVEPANLAEALAGLGELERRALADLLAGGGRLPRRYLQPRYGDFRPSGRLIGRARADEQDLSPLERLLVLGLLFYDRSAGELFAPAELIPLLENDLPLLMSAGTSAGSVTRDETPAGPPAPQLPFAGRYTPADLACHDLAVLLALLQREPVRPLHGHWLPPRILTAWGRHSVVPPLSLGARGELQTGRRRFLHYLAESGGFLPPGGLFLVPTPAAWLWLNASRADRLETLWQAWLAPDLDRWRLFRLPGWDWLKHPGRLIQALNAELVADSDREVPSLYRSLHSYLASLLARRPQFYDFVPPNFADPTAVLTSLLADLLAGPYSWLGLLSLVPGEAGAESGRDRDKESGSAETGRDSGRRLTAESLAWLGGPEPAAADSPRFTRFAIETDLQPDPLRSRLILTLDGSLPEPADLMAVMEMGREVEEQGSRGADRQGSSRDAEQGRKSTPAPRHPGIPAPILRYQITADSFVRALHRGWSPPALLDALNRLAGRPLTGPEINLLRTWAEVAGRAVIHPLVVLETADPAIIERLAADRRGRSLIRRTLSPRAVAVDPTRLDQLIRRLAEQEGLPPSVQVSAPVEGEQTARIAPLASPAPLPQPAHLWLALQVYRQLGQYLRLPVRIPQAVLDSVAALLSPTDIAAADTAAGQVMAALQDSLQGRDPFPPWPEEGLPLAESLPVIEAALAGGRLLEISYYTAGRAEVTRRMVEPYRLEWRGDVPYLVAFCHRVQAERVFRVDRIREIEERSRE